MDSLESKNKKYTQEVKAIVIGSIITLIGVFIYNGSYVYYLHYYSGGFYLDEETITLIPMLLLIIAGFVIAYINKPKYTTGIIIVAVSTVIGIYIYIYIYLVYSLEY